MAPTSCRLPAGADLQRVGHPDHLHDAGVQQPFHPLPDGPLRRSHHELLVHLLADRGSPEVQRRCELAGVPVSRRRLVGLALRPEAGQADAVVAAVVHAAPELRLAASIAETDDAVRVLISRGPAADVEAVADDLAGRVQ